LEFEVACDLDAFVSRLKSIQPRLDVSDADLLELFWQAHPRFQFFKSLPWGSTLLDIGADNGGLAHWKEWGKPSRTDLSLYGVDLTVGEYCDLYAGWEAINLDEQLPNFSGVPLNSFLVSHLIEHLAVPEELVQWLAARAEPGAKVYIEWQNPTSINLPTRHDLHKFGIDLTSSNFKDDVTRRSSPDPAVLCRWLTESGFTLISSGTIDLGGLGEELFARASDPGIRTMGYQSMTQSLLYAVAVKSAEPPVARPRPAAAIARGPGAGYAVESILTDARSESRGNPPESSYETRVASQVAQYSDTLDINELPQIFHYWSETYLAPRIENIFGTKSFADVICRAWLENEKPKRNRYSFASLGAGDCSIELEVAQQLLDRGVEDFEIHAFELSEPLVERARSASRHLERHLRIVACDINDYEIEGTYDGMMAHHSLHHFVNLERIFDNVKRVLAPNGNFVVWDMIGRNGHMRWPECLSIIDRLWPILPLPKRYNCQTHETWREFINFDCSNEGFEGIRAQDILPNLIERFHASHFVVNGGITDVFLDRSFGYNFNPDDEWDREFVALIEHLNARLIECGAIKPTLMYATFKTEPCDCRHEGHLTPEFCLRLPT
jgi:SAM-dependent methyltransferase